MADNAATIQGIQFEIVGNAKEGTKALREFKAALKELKGDFGGQVKGLSSLAKELSDFSKAISKDAVGKIRELATALGELKNVGKVNIDANLGNGVSTLAGALKAINSQDISKLTNFGNALKNMQGAKTNIGDKLPGQITAIANAVNQISDEAIKKLSRLTQALGRLKGVNIGSVGAVAKAQNAGNTVGATGQQSVQQAAKESGKTKQQQTSGFRNITDGNAFKQIKQWADDFRQLENIIRTVGTALKWIITPLKTIGSLVKKIIGIAKSIVTGVIGAVKKLGNAIVDIGKKALQFGKNFAKWTADKLGITAVAEGLKSLQKLISSFGRVALYRAVRSAIKYVTDQLKEGTENAYWFSREFGDATKYISEAYDNLASKEFKMSNQLGAAWSTLIATVEPVLIRLIDLVTRAANAVTQFFAILGGKSTYMKAIDYSKEWAESTTDGAKAAKEWKNQLMGFDEINRLEEPSSSSGGSGSSLPDYENMFTESPISGFFEDIRNMWNSGEYAEIGTMIADKVNGWFDSIDFDEIGSNIGKKTEGVIEVAFSFLDGSKAKEKGQKLMGFLNSLADEIDFETLGRLHTKLRTTLWNVIYGAFTAPGATAKLAANLSDYVIGALNELNDWINSLDPKEIADAIRNFFSNIKTDEIKYTFKTLITSAWTQAIALKDELFPDGLVSTVMGAISNFFNKISTAESTEVFKGKIKEIFTVINKKFDEIWPPEEREAFKENVKNGISKALKQAVGMIDFAAIHNIISYKIDEAIFPDWWVELTWGGKGDYAGKEFIQGLMNGVDQDSATVGQKTDMIAEDYVKSPFTGAAEDVEKTTGNMSGNVSRIFESMKSSISGITSKIKSDFTSSMSSIGTKAQSVWSSIKSDAGTTWENISKTISEKSKNIKSGATDMLKEVKAEFADKWSNVKTDTSDAWGKVKSSVSEAVSNMKTSSGTEVTTMTSKIKSLFTTMQSNSSSIFGNMNSKVQSTMSSMNSKVTKLASSIHDSLKDKFQNAYDHVSKIVEKLKNIFNFSWSLPHISLPHFSWDWTDVGGFFSVPNISVSWYANGGLPDVGEFFLAREAGPELVGRMGNKNAVANNEQIVEAVSKGVYEAVVDAMARGSGDGNEQPVNIYLDGRIIAQSTTRYQRQYARASGV